MNIFFLLISFELFAGDLIKITSQVLCLHLLQIYLKCNTCKCSYMVVYSFFHFCDGFLIKKETWPCKV